MAINEQWLPIISEGISWVRELIGPSKKELKIQISDLEKQVETLTAGNTVLANNFGLITQAILKQLKTESSFTINSDTIVFIGENTGSVDISKPVISGNSISGDVVAKKQVVEFDVSKIFDGLDEEIAHSRTTKPSDRR